MAYDELFKDVDELVIKLSTDIGSLVSNAISSEAPAPRQMEPQQMEPQQMEPQRWTPDVPSRKGTLRPMTPTLIPFGSKTRSPESVRARYGESAGLNGVLRWVHRELLKNRPRIGMSLTEYAKSTEVIDELSNYIVEEAIGTMSRNALGKQFSSIFKQFSKDLKEIILGHLPAPSAQPLPAKSTSATSYPASSKKWADRRARIGSGKNSGWTIADKYLEKSLEDMIRKGVNVTDKASINDFLKRKKIGWKLSAGDLLKKYIKKIVEEVRDLGDMEAGSPTGIQDIIDKLYNGVGGRAPELSNDKLDSLMPKVKPTPTPTEPKNKPDDVVDTTATGTQSDDPEDPDVDLDDLLNSIK